MSTSVRKRAIAVPLIISAVVTVGALVTLGSPFGLAAGPHHDGRLTIGMIPSPCTAGPVAWAPIFYLTAGGSSASGRRALSASGLRFHRAAVRAIGGNHAVKGEAIVWRGQDNLLLTRAERRRAAATGMQTLPVYPLSTNRDLCSIEHNLGDRPADQPLLTVAKASLVSAGLASQQQVNDTHTVYMLGDDPLDPSQVILTADVPASSSGCSFSAPYGGTCHGTYDVIAFVRLSDDVVTGVASGPASG